MKNATEYGKKVKRALSGMKRKHHADPAPVDLAPLEVLVLAVLRQNASLAQAQAAMELLDEEFVDFNEMRVAPAKDISDLMAGDMPDARAKAQQIIDGLNRIFDHENRLDFEHTADMGKRELRTHLQDALGLSSYVEAYLVLYLFDGRALPVDERLVERLKADGLADAKADISDVRTVLERVAPAKDPAATYEMLTVYAAEPLPVAKTAGRAKAASKKAKAPVKKVKAVVKTVPTTSKKAKTAAKPAKTAAKKAKAAKTTAKGVAKKSAKQSTGKSAAASATQGAGEGKATAAKTKKTSSRKKAGGKK